MNKNIKYILIGSIALLIIVICFIIFRDQGGNTPSKPLTFDESGDFTIDLIKNVNKNQDNNYLISPYSIEVALNMLREGSSGNTKKELDDVIGTRNLNINNSNVKIANGLFVKNTYKDVVEDNFTNTLKTKFNSEILYDEFKTPSVINNWVNKKTDGMIKNILNDMDPDFALGLANAIAIDVKWINKFDCIDTYSEEFNTYDGTKINVEMMHDYYKGNVKYLNEDVKGIILPYEENLEFIGLLPNSDIKKYVNNLTKESLDTLLNSFKEASSSKRVSLSLPRFSYEYSLDDFKQILVSMGIKDAFDNKMSDFSSIITKDNLLKFDKDNLYVSDAIHKTFIDLNESGTKAAAVTYFGMNTSSTIGPEEYEEIEIKFNKPFIYMIRDKESNEILFFGSVYEPNIWKSSTCDQVE